MLEALLRAPPRARASATERFDVAVVGAGPAGAATATLLAERGCRVALLHAEPPAAAPLGESLSGAAAALLVRLGVWVRSVPGRTGPSTRVPAPGAATSWSSRRLAPYGPAWLIDRKAFHELLRERSRQAGTRVLAARVAACRAEERGSWRLDLADGTVLVNRAVVDATGRSCWLTKAVGGRCEVHDRMAALVARLIPLEAPTHGPPVLVEATPGGWWYSALIPSGDLVALFITETIIARVDGLAAAWSEALAAAPYTRGRLQGARGTQPPGILPVTVQRAVVPRHRRRVSPSATPPSASTRSPEPGCEPAWKPQARPRAQWSRHSTATPPGPPLTPSGSAACSTPISQSVRATTTSRLAGPPLRFGRRGRFHQRRLLRCQPKGSVAEWTCPESGPNARRCGRIHSTAGCSGAPGVHCRGE